MCFSAEASFASSAVLTAVGVASTRNVSRPEQRLFAAIPLLFAAQQFSEGVVWTTLKSGGYVRLQDAAVAAFLIAALMLWPVVVPLSMWLMEEGRQRKFGLSCILAAGVAVSLLYAYCLISFDVFPRIDGFHIQYIDNFPANIIKITYPLYLVATILPLFISSARRMPVFGALIAVSCAVTGIFYAGYLTSVWCFFAALISATIYWILIEARNEARPATVKIKP
jgi:hypothetical protein